MTTPTTSIHSAAICGGLAVVVGFNRVNPAHGAGMVSRLASKPSASAH